MNRYTTIHRHFSPDTAAYAQAAQMETLKKIGKEVLERLIFGAIIAMLMAVIVLLS